MLTLYEVNELAKSTDQLTSPDELTQFNLRDEDGWLVLHSAAYYGNTPLLAYILHHHKDQIEATIPGTHMTPLLLASLANHYNAVALLIRHGANTNAKDTDLRNALHLTANGKIAELLAHYGTDLEAYDKNPIHSGPGETPLETAKREGKIHVQTAILEFLELQH